MTQRPPPTRAECTTPTPGIVDRESEGRDAGRRDRARIPQVKPTCVAVFRGCWCCGDHVIRSFSLVVSSFNSFVNRLLFNHFFLLGLLVLCTIPLFFPHRAPRSIYPDEFENFVERMRMQSANKSRNFPFDVDVIDPMLDVVLDTELGADLSRDA